MTFGWQLKCISSSTSLSIGQLYIVISIPAMYIQFQLLNTVITSLNEKIPIVQGMQR